MKIKALEWKLAWCALFLPLCLDSVALSPCFSAGFPQNRPADELIAEAENATRSGRFDIAEADYQTLVGTEPRSAMLWSNLGAVRVMRGDCAKALPALAKARALDPKLYSPWYFAGFCELQQHHDNAAFSNLSRAVELNPRDANAWSLRARAAGDLNRLGLAFASVVRALEVSTPKPELDYQAGEIALDLATECYSRVIAAPNATALALELEGERDAAQGLSELAIAAFRKALASEANSPELHFALGWVYFDSAKLPEAETEWRRCLELAPEAAWTKLRLALVLAREGKSAEAEGLIESLDAGSFETREEFRDYLACSRLLHRPEFGERALVHATAYFPRDAEFGQWAASADASREAPSETGPANLSAASRICLSVRFMLLTHRNAAPQLVGTLLRSGDEYRDFRRGFLRDEVSAVEKVVAARSDPLPKDPGEAFVLGQLLHWLSYEYDERLETNFPDSEIAQALAAENLLEAGQTDKAIEAYQALLARYGGSPEVFRSLARTYWTEHRWDESLAVLEKVLAADPYDATTLVNMGRIYSYRQDWNNAESSFARAVRIDPQLSEAHLGLGESLRRRGDTQAALKELRMAGELDPRNPRPHYALAQLYRKQHQAQLAEREMEVFQRLHSQTALVNSRKTLEFVPLE